MFEKSSERTWPSSGEVLRRERVEIPSGGGSMTRFGRPRFRRFASLSSYLQAHLRFRPPSTPKKPGPWILPLLPGSVWLPGALPVSPPSFSWSPSWVNPVAALFPSSPDPALTRNPGQKVGNDVTFDVSYLSGYKTFF